jgi:hypothetical protein
MRAGKLSIKDLDGPSTSWVVRQIRAEGQEMIARNEMLREQQKLRLQQQRLQEEAAAEEAAAEEAAIEEGAAENDDKGNLTPLDSRIRRSMYFQHPKGQGQGHASFAKAIG